MRDRRRVNILETSPKLEPFVVVASPSRDGPRAEYLCVPRVPRFNFDCSRLASHRSERLVNHARRRGLALRAVRPGPSIKEHSKDGGYLFTIGAGKSAKWPDRKPLALGESSTSQKGEGIKDGEDCSGRGCLCSHTIAPRYYKGLRGLQHSNPRARWLLLT